MSAPPLFASRTARMLVAVLAGGVLVILFFTVFGDVEPTPVSAASDSFSRSAIGYRALVLLLESELPVVVSRGYSVDKADRSNPLLLLEPSRAGALADLYDDTLATAMARELPVVLVLPKWRGLADPERAGWVAGVEPVSLDAPRALLEVILQSDQDAGAVIRPRDPGSWRSELAGGALPEISQPQLLRPLSQLEPLVVAEAGSLVARVANTSVYLVADPDLLNNHGLARPANARIAYGLLVDQLGAGGWILDEGLHGYQPTASVWQALLHYPLSPFTLHLAVLAALAIWAGSLRFGPLAAVPSRLPPGKWTLVDNTARLLALARRPGRSLARYLRLTVERAAAEVHLPPGLGYDRQLSELDRIAAGRGVRQTLREIELEIERDGGRRGAAVDPRRTLVLARALFRWRERLRRRPV